MKPVGLIDPPGTRPPPSAASPNLAAANTTRWSVSNQLWRAKTHLRDLWDSTTPKPRLGQSTGLASAPRVLLPTMQARERPTLLFAGQISGVEGYTESAATGLLAGMNAARLATGRPALTLPENTMLGALARYIASADASNYQPTNAAFGLLPEAPSRSRRKQDRREARSAAAMRSLTAWIEAHHEGALARPAL
jgi:methylenetetrahydrofolate--tRNA-(uracil-5-)-methyltransferase